MSTDQIILLSALVVVGLLCVGVYIMIRVDDICRRLDDIKRVANSIDNATDVLTAEHRWRRERWNRKGINATEAEERGMD